jgi:hypothetical protein
MKFTIDKESLDKFKLEKAVEIAGIFSEGEIHEINHEIDRILLTKKIETDKREEIMKQGRDLWRNSGVLRKMLKWGTLAHITYDLTWEKPLRFGFDQLYVEAMNTFDKERASKFLVPSLVLQDTSSVSDIVAGILIVLKSGGEKLPAKPGSVLFFNPEYSLDLSQMALGDRFLLMGITTIRSLYVYRPEDPQNHYLKHLGYVYGDKLKDTLHPPLLR